LYEIVTPSWRFHFDVIDAMTPVALLKASCWFCAYAWVRTSFDRRLQIVEMSVRFVRVVLPHVISSMRAHGPYGYY